MLGSLQAAAPGYQQDPVAPAQAGAAPAADDGETPNVSPEEQADYDKFVNNALEIIYPQGGGTVSPVVMKHLNGEYEQEAQQILAEAQPPLGVSPIDNLAGTTVLLVVALDQSATAAGKDVGQDVVIHGGVAVLEELATVAQAAKIHDYSDKEIEAATLRAMDLYRYVGPRYDENAAKQDFGQVVEADKTGTLDQVVPGIGQALKQQGG